MKHTILALTILALTSTSGVAKEQKLDRFGGVLEDHRDYVCNVSTLTETMFTKNGPLKGCNLGDVVHFQISHTRVSPATVAATYCRFGHQIMTDTIAGNSITHLVCRYQWKPSKSVQTQNLP